MLLPQLRTPPPDVKAVLDEINDLVRYMHEIRLQITQAMQSEGASLRDVKAALGRDINQDFLNKASMKMQDIRDMLPPANPAP
jgi:hypothetical protein